MLESPPASHVAVHYPDMALERTDQAEKSRTVRRSKRAWKSRAGRNQESAQETGNRRKDTRISPRRIKRAVSTAGRKEQCQKENEKADLQLVKKRAVDAKEIKVRNINL